MHPDCPDLNLFDVESEPEDDSDYEDDSSSCCSLQSYHIGGRMLTTHAIRYESDTDPETEIDSDDGSTVARNHGDEEPQAQLENQKEVDDDLDGEPCFSI